MRVLRNEFVVLERDQESTGVCMCVCAYSRTWVGHRSNQYLVALPQVLAQQVLQPRIAWGCMCMRMWYMCMCTCKEQRG